MVPVGSAEQLPSPNWVKFVCQRCMRVGAADDLDARASGSKPAEPSALETDRELPGRSIPPSSYSKRSPGCTWRLTRSTIQSRRGDGRLDRNGSPERRVVAEQVARSERPDAEAEPSTNRRCEGRRRP